MTVGFPYQFAVAERFCLAIVDEVNGFEWGFDTRGLVTMPVDGISQKLVGEVKKAEAIGQDRFSVLDQAGAPPDQQFILAACPTGQRCLADLKRASAGLVCCRCGYRTPAAPDLYKIDNLACLAAYAPRNLRSTHGA